MKQTTSETSRAPGPHPASMSHHAQRGIGNLVQPQYRNWHLMTVAAHAKLWACPSAPFAGRVLP